TRAGDQRRPRARRRTVTARVAEIETEIDCGAARCVNPSFCSTCREAEQRRARGGSPRPSNRAAVHIPPHWDGLPMDALSQLLNCERPTPQATIEAIMHSVRERGLGALREPATIERLSRCD